MGRLRLMPTEHVGLHGGAEADGGVQVGDPLQQGQHSSEPCPIFEIDQPVEHVGTHRSFRASIGKRPRGTYDGVRTIGSAGPLDAQPYVGCGQRRRRRGDSV
ncbi:hypothetical protein E2562_036993 [Oryza meyeriana var. granulata]|uniref:Uncharacterized protein n=1 Tax=Oryza meyeriana var. granulata TaxID=110450 RepID=A0A6G1F234_9ORYZ|nr:hypothetical protein E2562_036993 [Oryza meyeriana var. granulata]